MKRKITKTIEEEIDIEFPQYRKGSVHAYKIIGNGEWDCITVCFGSYKGTHVAIERQHTTIAWNDENNIDITEEEFNELFDKTMEKIIELTFDKKQ